MCGARGERATRFSAQERPFEFAMVVEGGAGAALGRMEEDEVE